MITLYDVIFGEQKMPVLNKSQLAQALLQKGVLAQSLTPVDTTSFYNCHLNVASITRNDRLAQIIRTMSKQVSDNDVKTALLPERPDHLFQEEKKDDDVFIWRLHNETQYEDSFLLKLIDLVIMCHKKHFIDGISLLETANEISNTPRFQVGNLFDNKTDINELFNYQNLFEAYKRLHKEQRFVLPKYTVNELSIRCSPVVVLSTLFYMKSENILNYIHDNRYDFWFLKLPLYFSSENSWHDLSVCIK